MKDKYGCEFTDNTVHCWNCIHYRDVENSAFSLCNKNRTALIMKQMKTLNPVTCVYFENKHKEDI